jgi:outer membrane lipoprotein
MVVRWIWRGLVIIGSLLACVACGSVISREARSLVNPAVSYAQIAANPAAHVGTTVLVAGTIIEAINLQEGTRLEILQFPTGAGDRPLTTATPGGRFLVLAPDYLETAIYRKGRAITLVGEVQGQRDLPLGETTYHYPLLLPRELYLWSEGYDTPRFHIGFGVGFSKGF